MKSDLQKLVTFRLGDALFAADIFAVERVLRYQAPRALPDVPPWIEGVIEYQARVVPVLNLRRRFEMPARDANGETRIVVLTSRSEWIGIVVDAVIEVSPIEAAQLSAPPAFFRGLAGEYMSGIVRRGGDSDTERLVVVLDVERLLAATERIVLELDVARKAAATAAVDG